MLALHNVALFITQIIFSFLIFVVSLRLLLQFFRAGFNNPICQFIAKMTNPVVLPLKNILPRVQWVDLASLAVLFIIEIIKFITLGFLQGIHLGIVPLIFLSFADMIVQISDILFFTIIIRVILSWVNPQLHNPLTEILYTITEPLLQWIRRFVPALSGFDFSPLVAIVGLKIINIIIMSYLPV